MLTLVEQGGGAWKGCAVIAQWVGRAGSRRFFIRRQVSAGSAKLSVGKTSRIASILSRVPCIGRAGDVVWRDSGHCYKSDAAFDTDAERQTYRDVRKPVSQQHNAGGD
jgi:hypothetical protein